MNSFFTMIYKILVTHTLFILGGHFIMYLIDVLGAQWVNTF